MDDMKKLELSDDELDTVVGGYEIGQTVRCKSWTERPFTGSPAIAAAIKPA